MLWPMAKSGRRAAPTAVYLESGTRRVFACALDWPGWCRSGRDEAGALEALAAAGARYSAVTAEAGIPFPAGAGDAFDVVERLRGSATTDFGAPGEVSASDRRVVTGEDADRLAALMAGSWNVFDRVVAEAPAELRKGPRGGGRDRDAIVEHVLGAEVEYTRKLGIRLTRPAPGDHAAVSAFRDAIAGAIRAASETRPAVEKGWPPRYAVRRIAWHVLDHAWEIEDRSAPPPG